MAKMTGLKLRCRDGRWEWANWEVRRIPHIPGGATATYAAVTPCELGDHWLWQEGDGTISARTHEAYLWPTREAAEAAISRWEQQEAGKA